MDQWINNAGLIIIMLSSLVYCFFGYRFFKALLSLAGAIIFGTVAWSISMELIQDKVLICVLIALVGSAIGAWLFYKIFKFAAFLYGAACGFGLSPLILPFIDSEAEWIRWTVPAVCALAGGILLLISHRLLLIIITSVSGALYFALSLFRLLIQFKVFEEDTMQEPDTVQISLWLICFLTVFISGLLFQLTDKNSKESE